MSDSQSFTISVENTNRPPSINSTAVRSAKEGEQYSYEIQASDPDGDPVTFSASGLPGWLSLSGNTLEGTPNYNQAGDYPVTVTADDGNGGEDSQSFTITVANTNRAPTFSSSPIEEAKENDLYTYLIEASDPDGDPVSFTAVQIPGFLNLTNDGSGRATLSGTPGYNHSGTYEITVRASDGDLTADQQFVITVENTNRRPSFTSSPVEDAKEAEFYSYSITTADPDGNNVTVSIGEAPGWLNLSNVNPTTGTATLSGTPGLDDSGDYTIQLIASDGDLSQTQNFTITVANTNQGPEIVSSPIEDAIETQLYSYDIQTSDPDGDPINISLADGPEWLSLTNEDPGAGTATLQGTPGYEDAGSYPVEIRATDGEYTATQSFTISVENTNRGPVFVSTPVEEGAEGQLYSYSIEASDPDGEPVSFTIQEGPGWLSLSSVNQAAGTATLSGTPGYEDAGEHEVEIRTSDGDLGDSQSFTITVANTNRGPEFVSSPVEEGTEGQPYSYNIEVSDPDGDWAIISVVTIPEWASLSAVDPASGTATLSGTPGYEHAGSYPVELIVSDGDLSDSQSFTISVENTNRGPVFVSTPVEEGVEGQPYSYSIEVSDPDGDALTISAGEIPEWASLSDNGDGTASLSGTPGYEEAGSYPVELTVSDGDLSESQSFTVSVANTNRGPQVSSTPPLSVEEGRLYSYLIEASDPDGDALSFSAEQIPEWASLSDNGDGTASLSGTPGYDDNGDYNIRIQVSDINDEPISVIHSFDIVVIDINGYPEFTSDPIVAAAEGQPYSYSITTNDPDGNNVTISLQEGPEWLSLSEVNPAAGTATLSGTPGYEHAGEHRVELRARDNGNPTLQVQQSFTISVANTNRGPVFVSTPVEEGAEGQLYSYSIEASDPDGEPVTISVTDLPGLFTFIDHGDGTGSLQAEPGYTDHGTYPIELVASDGDLSDTQSFEVVIADRNAPPVITSKPDTTGEENLLYTYQITTSDPDGDSVILSVGSLPAFLSFSDHGDGTGTLEGTPDYSQAGTYPIRVTANDGSEQTNQDFYLVIANSNRPPAFTSSERTEATEGQPYSYSITTADPDGQDITVSLIEGPAGASLASVNPSTGTALLEWTPTLDDAGDHEVVLQAEDPDGGVATQSFIITVANTNQAPEITSIALEAATEAEPYSYQIEASDPDGDELSFSAVEIPEWASLSDNGDGTATLSGTPGYEDAGEHEVEIIVSDGALSGSQSFMISVANSNRPPEFDSEPVISAAEGETYSYRIEASDPDGDSVWVSARTLPPFLTFTSNGDGVGILDGTPDYTQSGSYQVELVASDGDLQITQEFTIVVANTNVGVAFTSDPPGEATEGQPYEYHISATDEDGDEIHLVLADGPEWLSLVDEDPAGGTATLKGTPGYEDAGEHRVEIQATDTGNPPLTISQVYTLSVGNVNRPPVITSTQVTEGAEGETYSYSITTVDPDGDPVTISVTDLPVLFTFTDNGDGTGSLQAEPGYTDHGTYPIELVARDGDLSDTQSFEVVIADRNAPPVITSKPDSMAAENQLYSYLIEASDPDGDALTVSGLQVPEWASLSDNGDGTASLQGTPGFKDSGSYNASFEVSDGSETATQSFTITVANTNRLPVFDTEPVLSVEEGKPYLYEITASDPDGEEISLKAYGIPHWASFSTIGDGKAVLEGTPGYEDSGSYKMSIVAGDGIDQVNQEFTIVVANTNVGVAFTSDPPGEATEGQPYEYHISATDEDGDEIHLVLADGPEWLILVDEDPAGGTATLKGTPSLDDAGEYRIEIKATDTGNPPITISQVYTLTVANTNQAPQIVSTPVTEAKQTEPYSYLVEASDPDEDELSFSADQIPEWASLSDNGDGTASLSGTPGYEHAGSYPVEIKVSDDSLSVSQSFIIEVAKTNAAPVIISEPVKAVQAENPYEYIIIATDSRDAIADEVTFRVTLSDGSPLPGWLNLKDVSFADGRFGRAISGTPPAEAIGSYQLRIVAEDGQLQAEQSFTLEVTTENRPPKITSRPLAGINVDSLYIYHLTAIEPDGQNLAYRGIDLPGWLTLIDNGDGTGSLEGTPRLEDTGTYLIEIEVTDDGSPAKTDLQTYQLRVYENNKAPLIITTPPGGRPAESGVLVVELPTEVRYRYDIVVADTSDGIQGTLEVSASRGGGAPLPEFLSFEVIDGQDEQSGGPAKSKAGAGSTASGAEVVGKIVTSRLEGTPPLSEQDKEYHIVIEARDDAGLVSQQSFYLKVVQGNNEPAFRSQPVATATMGELYRYEAIAEDPDGDPVSYSLTMDDGQDLPGWLQTIPTDTSLVITGQPEESDIGQYALTLTATDHGIPAKSRSQSFTITVEYIQVTELKALYNYPNPFRSETAIKFELPFRDKVHLEVYNTAGALIRKTEPQLFAPGANEFNFRALNLASGIYIYRIVSSNATDTGRLTLIR